MLEDSYRKHFWCANQLDKAIPLKIKCFIWRAVSNRISVAANLEVRGIKVPSVTCPLCNKEKEASGDLLINCHVANEARVWILNWCGIPSNTLNTMTNFINFMVNYGNCPRKKERFIAIGYGWLWYIWKARNDKIFKQLHTSPTKIADEVISQTYVWFKYRTSDVQVRWIDWSISPFC